MTDDPGNCVICGAPIVRASNRRSGKKAITCTDPECRAERNRRYVRARYHRMAPAAPSRPRRSKPVFGGRAGVLHGKALAAAVEADRPGHGELAGVDWSPGDCPRRRGDDGPCIHVACIHHTCAEIDPARPSSLPDARKIVAALEEIAILRIIADEIEAGKHREEP